MQRRSILILALLGVLVILAFEAMPGFAAKEHGTPAQKAHAPKDQPPPIPSTQQVISGWCVDHPTECAPRSPSDPRVNSKRETCVDRWGNDDGYISPWELNKFGQNCYEQN